MRQIVLDTETTGLSYEEGHRIIEIGAVELVDRRFTGKILHYYVNPQRKITSGALSVHGITDAFLTDKPLFTEIIPDFIAFITGAELIIHNAPFDVGFLNNEFKLAKLSEDIEQYAKIFDTLSLARKKHPGKKNSLDALCKRYGIDNSKREFHGALLDAQLLAEVYLLMTSGQMNLFVDNVANLSASKEFRHVSNKKLMILSATTEEEKLHNLLLNKMRRANGKCLWEESL